LRNAERVVTKLSVILRWRIERLPGALPEVDELELISQLETPGVIPSEV
jgi:hypothetical protein